MPNTTCTAAATFTGEVTRVIRDECGCVSTEHHTDSQGWTGYWSQLLRQCPGHVAAAARFAAKMATATAEREAAAAAAVPEWERALLATVGL